MFWNCCYDIGILVSENTSRSHLTR